MELDAQALREEFAEHGVVAVRGLLGADDLAEARRCYEKVLHEPTSTYAASTYTDGSLYNPASGFTHESWLFEKLLGSSRILEALLAAWGDSENVWLVGPEIFYKKLAGSTDEAWVREGRNAERSDTPMHQDTRVIPYYGEHLANVWLSFEQLPEENSLQVVKGSHRGPLFDISDNLVTGMLPAPGGRGAAPVVRELVPPPQDFAGRGWEVFSPALSPGDAVIVHPGCIHGGGPCGPRCPERNTLVLRFFGDECRYRDDLGAFSANRPGKAQLEYGAHFSLRAGKDHVLGPGLSEAQREAGSGDAAPRL